MDKAWITTDATTTTRANYLGRAAGDGILVYPKLTYNLSPIGYSCGPELSVSSIIPIWTS